MQINPDYNEHYQWLVLYCKGWDDLKASSAEICVVCVLMTDGVCCFVVLTQSDRFIRMQCSRARTPPSSSGNITEKWNIFHNFTIILTRPGLSHWGWCHYQLPTWWGNHQMITDFPLLRAKAGLPWSVFVCVPAVLLLLTVTSFPCRDCSQSQPSLLPPPLGLGPAGTIWCR